MSAMADETPALPKTPVLLVSATRWEAAPLSRELGLSPVGEFRFEGRLGGRRVVLVKTGIGAAKTAGALEKHCVAKDFGLALSAGLCGALQPELKTGDLVVDGTAVELGYVAPLKESAESLGLRLHFGRLLHTNVVLAPESKRKLGAEQRAAACDMETAAVRRWAQASLPVLGVRAVLDELQDTLPADAPAGEDAASLARFALAHVGQMTGLVRTGLRCGRAMRNVARLLKAYLETI